MVQEEVRVLQNFRTLTLVVTVEMVLSLLDGGLVQIDLCNGSKKCSN